MTSNGSALQIEDKQEYDDEMDVVLPVVNQFVEFRVQFQVQRTAGHRQIQHTTPNSILRITFESLAIVGNGYQPRKGVSHIRWSGLCVLW